MFYNVSGDVNYDKCDGTGTDIFSRCLNGNDNNELIMDVEVWRRWRLSIQVKKLDV